ncbi:MAG: hypothetical protein PHT94_02620 [Candidatus Nanoarchaeia archaeon]|nr:hypothetical protein [Candidatus Nanoarchaeia archaeon]
MDPMQPPQNMQMNQFPGQPMPGMQPMQMQDQMQEDSSDDDLLNKLQEIIEAVVSEKLSDSLKKIEELEKYRDEISRRVDEMDFKFSLLREDFNNLNSSILGKIGDYDKNIVGIGTDLKAMERVFQKVLPVFTENINELGRIAKDFKELGRNN